MRASGGMADALASGASVRKDMGVQVPPRAPKLETGRTVTNSYLQMRNLIQINTWSNQLR
jgi:hypothetical protein